MARDIWRGAKAKCVCRQTLARRALQGDQPSPWKDSPGKSLEGGETCMHTETNPGECSQGLREARSELNRGDCQYLLTR
jgi:hypothetical protein